MFILKVTIITIVLGYIVAAIISPYLITYFVAGDKEFEAIIYSIFNYEKLSIFFVAVINVISGILFAYKKVSLITIGTFLRLFVFRIPVLFYFTNFTSLNSEAIGLAMIISQGLTGIYFIIIFYVVIIKREIKWKK